MRRTSSTAGVVEERFAPGTYCNLTQAEALNRPTFDVHDAGGVLASPPPAMGPTRPDTRQVQVITVPPADPSQSGRVVDEQPSAGTRAPTGSTVTIYVGSS